MVGSGAPTPASASGPTGPDPDESALWRAFKHGGDAGAREALFNRHLPLANGIARRRSQRRAGGLVELDDLRQWAITGLLDAIDRFDPARGAPFRSYAARRITGAILDGIAESSEVHSQISQRNRLRYERTRSLVEADAGASPPARALDALIEIAFGLAVGFMLEDTGLYVEAGAPDLRANQYETLSYREALRGVSDAVGKLPAREQTIIRRHYLEGLTFDQIGRLLGLSKGRISQLHRGAIAQLRDRLRVGEDFNLER